MFQKWYNGIKKKTKELKMSKLRKLTRDDFEDTADLSDSKFSNTVIRSTLFTDSDVSRVDFTFTLLNGYSLSNLKEAKNLDLTLREMAANSKGNCKKMVSSGK